MPILIPFFSYQVLGISNILESVEQLQENFQTIEMSAIFYDGPSVSFDKKTDSVIEEMTTNYLIEYISDDLSKSKDENKKWTVKGQGLLDDEDEAHGADRIYEALQTCMWSNMSKINTGPSLLPQGALL